MHSISCISAPTTCKCFHVEFSDMNISNVGMAVPGMMYPDAQPKLKKTCRPLSLGVRRDLAACKLMMMTMCHPTHGA